MDGQLELQGSQVAADGTSKLLFDVRVCSSPACTFLPIEGRPSTGRKID